MEIKYLVDFDPSLSEVISETKYLETLGFIVPELARNVALQVCTIIVACSAERPVGVTLPSPWSWGTTCRTLPSDHGSAALMQFAHLPLWTSFF